MEKFVHQLDCCEGNCANTRIGCIFNLGYTQCYNQQKSSLKKELHNSSLNTPTFISFINDSFGISSSNPGVSLAEIGVASLPSDYEYLSPPIPKLFQFLPKWLVDLKRTIYWELILSLISMQHNNQLCW